MVDLAQTISEWKDVEGNKEDDQYLGDICFSLRYVPTSGKVNILQNPKDQKSSYIYFLFILYNSFSSSLSESLQLLFIIAYYVMHGLLDFTNI